MGESPAKFPAVKLCRLALGSVVALLTWGCSGDSVTSPKPLQVAGTWTGTESDRLGAARLTWTLAQTGYTVTGTAIMRPVDAADGSCASCHKSKDGTFSGTVTGESLAFYMYFAAGGAADPTPECSIAISGTAPDITESAITGSYSGTDPCEGLFDGVLAMSRTP